MYQVERTGEDVLTIRHEGIKAGWEQRYLLISDVHFDSPHCDRKLLTKHLQQAKDSNAGIMVFGDWFDAMGGRNDRRAHKGGIRVEHSADNYFDCIVDDSVAYLSSYAPHIVMLGDGNHETAITRHNETDILERLCRRLGCCHTGYSGFVRCLFDGGKQTSRQLYYHHGSGGGGPVTRGMSWFQRLLAEVKADIYVKGHIHEDWVARAMVEECSERGVRYQSCKTGIQLPSYKRKGSWENEKGMPSKPLGGYWLIFHWDVDAIGRVGYRVERTN